MIVDPELMTDCQKEARQEAIRQYLRIFGVAVARLEGRRLGLEPQAVEELIAKFDQEEKEEDDARTNYA